MTVAPSEAVCQDGLTGCVNRSSLDTSCSDVTHADKLTLPQIVADAGSCVSSSHSLTSNGALTVYQKQKAWSDSCSRAEGILRTRRPSDIDFARSPGCSVSTKCPSNSDLSTPALSRWSSVQSGSSLPAVQADDDNPELRATRIQRPAADSAGHGSRCKPGACRCGMVRIETTVDILEPVILDETQYPRLLQRARPDGKASSLSSLGVKMKQPVARHCDPVEAAHARIQQRFQLRGPHSSSQLPPRPAAREERPEVKMRRRLYQESLTARKAELMEQISALRDLLNDSQPQPRAAVERCQKLKGALELSLQGVHCLLEDTMSQKKIIAIAQPCTPGLVERDHDRFPVYAQYRHSVKISGAWTDNDLSAPEPD
eukprot:TRINITY_DN41241_c0_g1_i1.p1 TRINITY_DN41241_c0_g1~~TRINITY_DN41241_c0_g1_i1.p1  ORF type:complete len:372 (-),score=53.57 TRINITY_DN41241_c0_g1_i1:221-1336(-)